MHLAKINMKPNLSAQAINVYKGSGEGHGLWYTRQGSDCEIGEIQSSHLPRLMRRAVELCALWSLSVSIVQSSEYSRAEGEVTQNQKYRVLVA